jgi:hypothetical protein
MTEWFSASLLYRAEHEIQTGGQELWEEKVVLVQASDQSAAERIAREIGEQGQHSYSVTDPRPHLLNWRFVAVERVMPTDCEPTHGAEIFSRFISGTTAKELLSPSE